MENKNVNTTGMQEADAAEEQEMEMQQAQAGGTVDFNKKKEEKQASLNYTHPRRMQAENMQQGIMQCIWMGKKWLKLTR